MGAGGAKAGREEGEGPGGVSQEAVGFSGSGGGAATRAAPAAEGGAAALSSPRFRGKSELRAPARSDAPSPAPPASGKAGPEQRLLIAPARPRKGAGPGEGARGGARSPRSSSPSLNWPLSLIRSCRSSSGCGGSRAGELSGPEAVAKGAWPLGGGGTAGPGVLRRSLPAAVSMARGGGSGRRRRALRGLESEVRGAAAGSGRRDGPTARAPRSGSAAAAGGGGVCGSRAARVAGGRDSGPAAAAALRPRGQVRAAGTRPEAPAPEPAPRGRWGGRDPARPEAWRLGVWAGLLGKPGPAETRAGPAEGVMGDPPHSCRGMVTRGDRLGPASFTVREGCARAWLGKRSAP